MANEIVLHTSAGAALAILDESDRKRANFDAWMSGYSASTRAMMASVWRLYLEWCKRTGNEAYRLDRAQLIAFMVDNPAARSTQQARATHLRAMLAEYVTQSPDDKEAARCLALLTTFNLPKKAPADYPDMFKHARARRSGKALQAKDIYDALNREWETPEATARNRAILALGFYAALRRAEIGALRWDNIDFSEGMIAVVGSKHRAQDEKDEIPLRKELIPYLRNWQAIATDPTRRTDAGRESLTTGKPVYVLCEISKAGNLGEDKPFSGESVRRVCGEDFMPHDMRRTFGTRSIEAGTPVNKVQKILRHEQPDTTLNYARHVEAKSLKDIELGY